MALSQYFGWKRQPAQNSAKRGQTSLPLWLMVLAVGVAIAAHPKTPNKQADPRLHTRDTPRPEGPSGEPVRPSRGHRAESPAQIPTRGWWGITKRVVSQISSHRLVAEAAGVTFYAILAVFPALATLVSIYGLFANPASISQHVNALSGVVPDTGMDIISNQLHSLASASDEALSIDVVIGALLSLWSANAGTKALFAALNVVHGEREKRSFIWLTFLTLCFTLGMLLFVLVALAAIVVAPFVLSYVGLGQFRNILLNVLRWPVVLVAITIVLAFLYRFGPSRDEARWRWVSLGGAFAVIAWLIGSAAFSWYVGHFGNFNKTYGSLGAAMGFMTWIWLSSLVILIGAQVNAEMENQP